MRSLALLTAALPALIAAAPEHVPRITSLRISGTGCPNNSGSVKSTNGVLADTATFTFGQLRGEDTDNCEIHIQSTGASEGWQVAVKEVAYQSNVALKPGSQLDTITSAFWSEAAADTSVMRTSLTCAGPELKDSVTIRSSTSDLSWSKCTGADGNPGILNVNARPVVQGNAGSYDFKQVTWGLVWRKC
ncbi:hypothetical protein K458DRAFT_318418 [Lentithecium fluviatile CBS 122367]|uniref:Secreted protein n=1 Tax=Lentithecium fluviatile CBS 122367 TaxID=1168545 RepID=A0A6G1II35_9PLEO|nr:hypothetical protein K458DRAFT_318418 [Lentithecium fluviatile CBS 122367]